MDQGAPGHDDVPDLRRLKIHPERLLNLESDVEEVDGFRPEILHQRCGGNHLGLLKPQGVHQDLPQGGLDLRPTPFTMVFLCRISHSLPLLPLQVSAERYLRRPHANESYTNPPSTENT